MSKVYAIANQKGGVSKTTTTFNLGDILAKRGHRVLMIDLDQQGSLTHCAKQVLQPGQDHLYHVLKSHAFELELNTPPISLASVVRVIRPHLALVPTNRDLASLDIEIVAATEREQILKLALEPIRQQCDYVLIDCPPSLGLLVINALVAADEVIIPLQTDYLATSGVRDLLQTISFVQRRLNPELGYAGVLLTMADERTRHSRQVVERAKADFAGRIPVFEQLVKYSVRVKEAPIKGQSIFDYDPGGEPAAAYLAMAIELEQRNAAA